MANSSIEYFEDLAIAGMICPPEDAVPPDGTKEYYRVVKHNPATSECFISYRAKYPAEIFHDECEAHAISLSDNLQGLINGYFKTPAHKKKKRLIGHLILQFKDGVLKQTGAVSHYSWWRSRAFIPECVPVRSVVA